MQLVAFQTHHEGLSSFHLKLAADDDGHHRQVLLQQQGLAERQQPHQQHVVSPTANMASVAGKTLCCDMPYACAPVCSCLICLLQR